MSTLRKVQVTVDAVGFGHVLIDGEELKGIRDGVIRFGAGELTEVTLTLTNVEVTTDVAGRVMLQANHIGSDGWLTVVPWKSWLGGRLARVITWLERRARR
jgi:hypothetical protein